MAGQAEARMNIVRGPDGLAVALPDWRAFFHNRVSGNTNTLNVPRNEEWHVFSIYVICTTDASQGDRQLVVEFQDVNANLRGEVRARAVQAASLVRYYYFGPALAMDTDFYDTNYLTVPLIPGLVLSPRAQIITYDNNLISANDRLDVSLIAARRLVA